MSDEHLSSLERVRRKLYSNEPIVSAGADGLSQKPAYETKGWNQLKVTEVLKTESEHMSGPARFFIATLVFFVVTLAAAGIYLYFGGGSVSTNNLNVTLEGPASIASGDTVPIRISIDNKNPTTIQNVKITLVYPADTKSPDNPSEPMPNYVKDIGSIASGGHAEETVRANIYGSEGQRISIPVKVEFTTDGTKSVFVKQKTYEFVVTSSPISINATSLSEISSGQPFTVDAVVKSNATTELQNIAVQVEYPPYGFALTTADPKATSGSLYYIGSLQPGEEKHIKLTGIASGEEGDQRIFKFLGGTVSGASATALSTTFTQKDVSVKVTKPFLATTLSINSSTADNPTVVPGAINQGAVRWTNNLTTPVTNAEVTIQLSGEALDTSTVNAGSGFFRSTDSTIVYTGQANPSLANLPSGGSGQGNFSFATKKPALLAKLHDPTITMKVSITGQRIGQNSVPEKVTATATRVIRVGMNVSLTSRAVRTVGGIKNTGPWPPEANQETTYTIQYTFNNTSNGVNGARVTAALPSYVRYTGVTLPADGSVTFDSASRTITWNAGTIPQGTASKTVSFQVGLTPSTAQSGSPITLVGPQTLSGTDAFTQATIQGTVGEITTQTLSDPQYTDAKGKVK